MTTRRHRRRGGIRIAPPRNSDDRAYLNLLLTGLAQIVQGRIWTGSIMLAVHAAALFVLMFIQGIFEFSGSVVGAWITVFFVFAEVILWTMYTIRDAHAWPAEEMAARHLAKLCDLVGIPEMKPEAVALEPAEAQVMMKALERTRPSRVEDSSEPPADVMDGFETLGRPIVGDDGTLYGYDLVAAPDAIAHESTSTQKTEPEVRPEEVKCEGVPKRLSRRVTGNPADHPRPISSVSRRGYPRSANA